jgi:Fe(3+) dicitrate transport protein
MVWIPGLGILYKISDVQYIYQRSQRVFASEAGEDAENSLNTELGFRFDKGAYTEVIGYYNNFESARF